MNKPKIRIARFDKLYSIVIFVALLIFIFSCSSSKVSDIINGSFEKTDYGGGDPDGWFANRLPGTEKYAELSTDDNTAHSGEKSISIGISKIYSGQERTYNWVRRVDGLRVSRVYELNAWIKTKAINNSPFIEMQFWNNNSMIGKTSTKKTCSVTGTANWQPVNLVFKVPKGTTKALILAALESSQNSGGKAWFDDIKLVELVSSNFILLGRNRLM